MVRSEDLLKYRQIFRMKILVPSDAMYAKFTEISNTMNELAFPERMLISEV